MTTNSDGGGGDDHAQCPKSVSGPMRLTAAHSNVAQPHLRRKEKSTTVLSTSLFLPLTHYHRSQRLPLREALNSKFLFLSRNPVADRMALELWQHRKRQKALREMIS